ncbi:barstar family protein [Marinoscillum sp. MHG1-6]|uniref:barstar family protein n=1 Tax=Marinoscillum sp. MHG1-6 TaxID=2959627 RepID=UPI002157F7C1|nr:barstar family protein [Marinoscillum sp. MHG1-6]
MKTYRINGNKITNWKSFHSEFKKQMNFPDYYGENMDAWIDCVDELSDEPTHIEITKGHLLKEQAPELLEAILECSAFVNFRKVEQGEQPTLMISTRS